MARLSNDGADVRDRLRINPKQWDVRDSGLPEFRMKIRVNILSAGPSASLDWLRGLREKVPVFHTKLGRVVGTAFDYDVQGEDLWAILDLEDGTPWAERSAGVVVFNRGAPNLVGVLYTDLSREQIGSLGRDTSMGARPGSSS